MEQALEEAKGMTFEKMWALMMEDRKKMEQKEEAREKEYQQMRESQEKARVAEEKAWKEIRESSRKLEKSIADTQKSIAETNKNIGGINNTLGELTEAMFAANMWEKFEGFGYPVHTQCRGRQFKEGKKLLAEADVFIENGEYAIVVEIKTKLDYDDINRHLERMEIIRNHFDKCGDSRKLIGAVAGGTVPEDMLSYAQKKGFIVIVQNGNSVAFAPLPQGFKAREW